MLTPAQRHWIRERIDTELNKAVAQGAEGAAAVVASVPRTRTELDLLYRVGHEGLVAHYRHNDYLDRDARLRATGVAEIRLWQFMWRRLIGGQSVETRIGTPSLSRSYTRSRFFMIFCSTSAARSTSFISATAAT